MLTRNRLAGLRTGSPAGTNLVGARVTIVGGGGITESLVRLLGPFDAHITVVRNRVEPLEGKTGVGIRITESHLERRDRRSQAERRRSSRPERRRPWDPRSSETEERAKVA